MKKIEYFLDDYSWLLKSVIVCLLIFWAMQGSYVVKEMYKEIKNQPPRDTEVEEKMTVEVNRLMEELIEKAKTNKAYGPKDYFEDYRRIETRKYEFKYPYDPAFYLRKIGKLQIIAMQNVGNGRPYNTNDISEASKSFSEWKKSGGPVGDEFRKEAHDKIEEIGYEKVFLKILNWGWSCYLRGFLLVLFLFIIRMANRKGVAETILADKKRFFLAVFFWPFFLSKYPFNIVREIIVEAEIRRLGNFFRRLSEKERELVRKVASSGSFWEWVAEFQGANKLAFQRAFAVALIPAILMYFFIPKATEAKEYKSTRDGPVIFESIPQEEVISLDSNDSEENQSIYPALFEENCFVKPLDGAMILRMLEEKIKLKSIFRKIEHVPIFGRYFVSLCKIQYNTN